jgi:hypothetical protein
VLIAFGLLSAFGGNVLGGMWLVFIGWFLRNAAISSYQQHLLLDVLSGVRAGQAMTPDPETVPADATVRELMEEYFMRRRYAAYPVTRRRRTLGLVTLQRAGGAARGVGHAAPRATSWSPFDEHHWSVRRTSRWSPCWTS